MKLLLAVDESTCSDAAVQEVARRSWPDDTEVRVLSVVHDIAYFPDPTLIGAAAFAQATERKHDQAKEVVAKAAEAIQRGSSDLKVTTEVLEGKPKEVIVEEAERWQADLILMGAHGRSAIRRFLLGSVSHAVTLHAPCSVEVVRPRASARVA